jgi:hypothetical protein
MLGFGARIDDGNPNSGDVRAGISYSYNGDLTFHAKAGASVADGSYERIRIDGATGNVGIGNNAPDQKLVVGDDSTYNTIKIEGIDANLAASLKFKHHGGGGRTGVTPEWNISRGSDQTSFNTGVTAGNATVGGLAFWNNTVGGGNVDAMRLKDNGDAIFGYNVGIGTDNPNRPLTIASNSGANAIAIRARSANDYSFIQFFDNAGTTVRSQIYNHNNELKFSGGPSSDQVNNFTVTSDNTISLPNRTADPTGAEGDMYYNTTFGAPRIKTVNGWVSFGVALGTQANPVTSVGQAQANSLSTGLHWFQNSSGQTQELYYDSADGGWIMVSSNNASSTTIPSGNGRHSLAYTIRRNGTVGALGTASPDNDYLIGGWVDNFSWTRARLVGFGRGSTNGTYSWSNLGTYIVCQANFSGWATVQTLNNISVSGNSSVYTQNSGYWTVDGIQADYNNGGFSANPNQTTIGMVGVAASDGDPDSGCYMGHGTTEGHYEGWYDSGGGSADCQGYTTWVR